MGSMIGLLFALSAMPYRKQEVTPKLPEIGLLAYGLLKSIKDTGSRLYLKLKEAVIQTGMEKNVFGSNVVSMSPPPAFSSDQHISISGVVEREKSDTNTYGSAKDSSLPSSLVGNEKYPDELYLNSVDIGYSKLSGENIEIDGPSPAGKQANNFMKDTSSNGVSYT